ncbi:antifreeze protein [Brucella gallinifaecis]|uniref:Antifreeze protein n=1 Tax=Brucella gallinifaecis TaxID=215590 RepID=A0A502BS01_9HYPH|nr:antifreeze protein [Brucella gallinifaecis]TPF76590.1 antifreeze protein [Brucella gallinifaecis]
MSAISFKSFVVTAAIGLAAVFTAGASANAAPSAAAPAFNASAHSSLIQIDHRSNRHHGRPAYRGPACSVENAKMKAQRMGIRNARVAYRGKSVQVRGSRHGRPASAVFANTRGCPTIR